MGTDIGSLGPVEPPNAAMPLEPGREQIPTVALNQAGTLHRRKAVLLVLLCTILGAGAQFLLKFGSQAVDTSSLVAIVWSMATNVPLVAGLSLYGLSMVLFVHALRNEQLSLLYPLISLTYIWVTGLSIVFLNESVSIWKVAGVAVIVLGVAFLGRDQSAA